MRWSIWGWHSGMQKITWWSSWSPLTFEEDIWCLLIKHFVFLGKLVFLPSLIAHFISSCFFSSFFRYHPFSFFLENLYFLFRDNLFCNAFSWAARLFEADRWLCATCLCGTDICHYALLIMDGSKHKRFRRMLYIRTKQNAGSHSCLRFSWFFMCYPFTGQSWFFLCCALQDVRGGEKGVQKEDSSSCAGAGAGDLLWWCKWGGCRGALCQICSAQGLLDMAHVHDGLCPYLVLELHPCLLLHVTALTGEKGGRGRLWFPMRCASRHSHKCSQGAGVFAVHVCCGGWVILKLQSNSISW